MKTYDFHDDAHGLVGSRILCGAQVGSVEELAEQLMHRQKQKLFPTPQATGAQQHLKVGNLTIPPYLEHLGFFYVGSPGSGKSHTIFSNVNTITKRPNFRAVIIDRNGEILEKFYDPKKFLIFNPQDTRSVMWSHRTEGVDFEMIANSLIPCQDHRELFWPTAAIQLLSSIFDVAETNNDVYQLLNESLENLSEKIPDHAWLRNSERTGGSIIATAKTYLGFYKHLPDAGDPFSFFQWASGNDPRSLIIPLFTEDVDRYKSLVTMALRQVFKGLICNEEGREVQTAVIIDELGALYALDELLDLLAQGRKFKTCFIGATQTLSQVAKVYGQEGANILLQTVRTKLILNCPDYSSAEVLAQCIGMQEKVDIIKSFQSIGGLTYTEQLREGYAIHPSEIQQLPPLTGYVHISEGLPTALVSIEPVSYTAKAPRRIYCPERRESPKCPQKSSSKISRLFEKGESLDLYIFEELWRIRMTVNYFRAIPAIEGLVVEADILSEWEERLNEKWPQIQSKLQEQWNKLNGNQRRDLIKDVFADIFKESIPKLEDRKH